ncbi:MAG: cytochrome oxidase subunit [Labilithrix sp.]|nr:cytochrome oxidase subunit [Labilithrix sp.]
MTSLPLSAPASRPDEIPVKPVPVIDVTDLPLFAFGSRSPVFWGTAMLCCIEGTALALLFTSYFYLRGNFDTWPPFERPPPVTGSVATVVLALSLVPMILTGRAARTMNLAKTRKWQVISTIVGAVALGLRAWELHALPFAWDETAYGSVVWSSFGFHTIDFAAEMVEMLVLCAILFKGPVEDKHFEDVQVNAFFWGFLVLSWLPFAGVFYLDGVIR